MKETIRNNIKALLSWEFFLIFILNLVYFMVIIQDRFYYGTTIYDYIGMTQLISLPLLILILYKYSKNQSFKEMIKGYFSSAFKPAIVTGCALMVSITTLFIQQFYRNAKYHTDYDMLRPWIITVYLEYIFITFLVLILVSSLYQLIIKQRDKSIASFGLACALGVAFFVLNVLSFFI